MRIIGSVASNESSETDVEGGTHEVLTQPSDPLRQSKNGNVEMSDSSLDALLGRISEKPRQEIGSLTDRLRKLHDKLQADRSRIRRDIVEYAGLNEQIAQMAAIISDSVKKLLDAPGISRRNRRGRRPASAPQLIEQGAP
jgi:hypothetical protein